MEIVFWMKLHFISVNTWGLTLSRVIRLVAFLSFESSFRIRGADALIAVY
ncbi:hypothetical protein [Oceanobacillus sp. FSL W7-1293]